jgi:hypothetical protein
VQPLWKTIWRLLKKLGLDLPCDPAISLQGIYPTDCKSGYYTGTCTAKFIAALFTIAKLWKQPRSPTTDKWIKKMRYLYTIEFYSATKKNEICHSQVNGRNWRTSSEVSLAQKAKSHLLKPHMWTVEEKQQFYGTWSHTKGRLGKWGKPKTWLRLICPLYRNEYRNFKLGKGTREEW